MPTLPSTRHLLLTLLLAAAPACTQETEETSGSGGDSPWLEPKTVPAAPPVVAAKTTCVPLQSGEALWSVSPEGHAWVASTDSETLSVRVLDPFAPGDEFTGSFALGESQHLHAWSQTDATVVTTAGLWSLDNLDRIELTPPTEPSGVTSLCGDPSRDGMLLAGGALYELREDTWWAWEAKAGAADAPSRIVPFDGDCVGESNLSWLTADDGSLYSLTATTYAKTMQFEAGASSAATSGLLAVLESDRLLIGPAPWQPWIFDGATPTLMSASGGSVWLAAGSQLLRYDGETFNEIAHELDAPMTKIAVHASGAWISGETEICHVSTGPMLRIDGLRPYRRAKDTGYDFTVSSSDPELVITASVDGIAVELTPDPDTHILSGHLELSKVGWTELLLEAEGTTRAIPVKRLPTVERSWATDIEPIYLAHCANATCHGAPSSGLIDIASYGAWVDAANKINARAVIAGDMPPPPQADWGSEQTTIVAEWLEGGMLP